MKTVVVTAVHGRTEHLRRQVDGLSRSRTSIDRHVVVAMNDSTVSDAVPQDDPRIEVISLNSPTDRLPIAAARNIGARAAVQAGADLIVFLDVDCIPAPGMITAYQRAAGMPEHRDALLCGPVTYLSAQDSRGDLSGLDALAAPHPARPAPSEGEILMSTDYQLFWSLSFGVIPSVWHRLGGFCTDYTGYGGEDTDFAQQAAAHGVTMRWVGGADAFHQYHLVSNPPIEHLHDIVTNAAIFHRRWGWWPMRGWLDDFERLQLIERDADGRPWIC